MSNPAQRLEWSLRVRAQLQEILAYHLQHTSAETAGRVLRPIEAQARRLAQFPETGTAIRDLSPEYRRCPAGDYTILYRVLPERSVVRIFAIRHGRRRPLSPAEIIALDAEG